MSLLHEAKKNIRWRQQQTSSEGIKQLKNTHKQKEKQLKKKSGIYNLDPYLDKRKRIIESWRKIEKIKASFQ